MMTMKIRMIVALRTVSSLQIMIVGNKTLMVLLTTNLQLVALIMKVNTAVNALI